MDFNLKIVTILKPFLMAKRNNKWLFGGNCGSNLQYSTFDYPNAKVKG